MKKKMSIMKINELKKKKEMNKRNNNNNKICKLLKN